MAIQKVDISTVGSLVKAIEFSAQQCGAPLSAWITHCCCAATPRQYLVGLPNRTTKPATRPPARVTLEDVRQAGERSKRKTISCPDGYSLVWSNMANESDQSVSSWVIRCCLPYLAHEVRELIPSGDQSKFDDRTSTLGYRLFHLYHVLDHRESKRCLWAEFEPENTHLFSHLPDLPASLLDELDQIVDRMLVLAKTGDENPMSDDEVDTKIRFYFRASKRKLQRSEEELQESRNMFAQIENLATALKIGRRQGATTRKANPRVYTSNLFLFRNNELRIDQKLERLRASKLIYRLKSQAKEGISKEQFLTELHGQDPFLQYVKSQFDERAGTVYDVLDSLCAYSYCDDLDYRLSEDSDDD